MMKKLLVEKLALLALTVGTTFGLSSCKDELNEAPARPISQQEQAVDGPIGQYIGKTNIIFQSEMSLEAIQTARMTYYLEDRDTRRGNRGAEEYKQELSPTMLVKKGDRFNSILIFMRVPKGSEPVQFVRKEVTLEVIEGPAGPRAEGYKLGADYKAGGTAIVRWKGDVDFPTNYTMSDEFLREALLTPPIEYRGYDMVEGQWYVMATMGYNTAVYNTSGMGGNDRAFYNYISPEELEALPEHDPRRYAANYAVTPAYTSADNFFNILHPHVSDWKRLKICKGKNAWGGTAYSGLAEEVILRPQGTLLTYDLAINENLLQDIRGYGVVSNAVDFRGYYDLSGQSLYDRFVASGETAKPRWVSVRNTPMVSFYDDDSNNGVLTAGERIYPFDLVSTSGPYGPQMWGGSAGARLNVTDAPSMFYVYYVPGKAQVFGGNIGLDENSWMGNPLGSWIRRGGAWVPANSRAIFTIWGMPREQRPAKPATYFFASVYPVLNDELFHQDFNPTSQIYDPGRRVERGRIEIRDYQNDERTLPQRIQDKERQIQNLEQQIAQHETVPAAETELERNRRLYELGLYRDALESAQGELTRMNNRQNSLPAELQRLTREYPESLFTTYAADSTVFYGNYLPAFLRSGGQRAQPWLTLHQSNTPFTSGRIYHARPTLTSDLLLTEVHYEMRNGYNYSTVEVYNPTWLPADMTRYAIARLVPSSDGSHLAYRKYDGTTTENLAEAQLLPLTAFVPNQPATSDAYTLSEFARPAGYDTRAPNHEGGTNYNRRLFQIQYSQSEWGRGKFAIPGWYVNYATTSSVTGVGSTQNRDIYGSDLVANEWLDHDIGSMRHYILPRQTMMFGATGWVNRRMFYDRDNTEPTNRGWAWVNDRGFVYTPEPFPLAPVNWEGTSWRLENSEWFFEHYRQFTKAEARAKSQRHLKAMIAYADGPLLQTPTNDRREYYAEGTMDYRPGDAFVLVKKMPGGGLQVIDATGPVGREQKAFPGTYADFRAEFAKYTNLDHFSVQKLQAVDYPFIAPYRTTRVPANQRYSDWSDTWRVVTSYRDYTTGIYTDPNILHTEGEFGPMIGLYGAPFPPYRRSVWKTSEYDWQAAKRLKPAR